MRVRPPGAERRRVWLVGTFSTGEFVFHTHWSQDGQEVEA
jgi:hypothetical protein